MSIFGTALLVEKGAKSVTKPCMGCGQNTDFVLCSSKSGPGIGVPLVSLFTQRAMIAKKSYALMCPACYFTMRVSREAANELKSAS